LAYSGHPSSVFVSRLLFKEREKERNGLSKIYKNCTYMYIHAWPLIT